MVAYRCRYEPYNQEMIKMAREQELGPVKVIVADHGFSIGDPTQWRLKQGDGRRRLADGHRHLRLNAARYLTGEEPVEVAAMSYTTPGDARFKEVEETINFQLRFPSGVLANCTSSYGYSAQNRYRVISTKGWFELEPATSYTGLRMRVAARQRDRGAQPAGARPLRGRDGPPLRVRDGRQGAAHAGRGGPARPEADDGDLRGREDRPHDQGLAGQRRLLRDDRRRERRAVDERRGAAQPRLLAERDDQDLGVARLANQRLLAHRLAHAGQHDVPGRR